MLLLEIATTILLETGVIIFMSEKKKLNKLLDLD